MNCDQTALLRHLSVHNPAALAEEPWLSHIHGCPVCQQERKGYSWSLAIYSAIEREHASRLNRTPAWNALARRLAEQRAAHRRARAMAAPWLAGIAGLVMVGGLVSLGVWNDPDQPYPLNLSAQEEPLPAAPSKVAQRPVPVRLLTPVSAGGPHPAPLAGGGYKRTISEWRSLPRAAALLESNSVAFERPSGDFLIMPFGHTRSQSVRLVPMHNSAAQAGSPYGVSSPVR